MAEPGSASRVQAVRQLSNTKLPAKGKTTVTQQQTVSKYVNWPVNLEKKKCDSGGVADHPKTTTKLLASSAASFGLAVKS